MKLLTTAALIAIFTALSHTALADTTNTIKQKGTNNTIDNQILGHGKLSSLMTSGSLSVGGTATQNSIMVNDTKHTSTNTIDLNGGTNKIVGQGTQNSITVGKPQ